MIKFGWTTKQIETEMSEDDLNKILFVLEKMEKAAELDRKYEEMKRKA